MYKQKGMAKAITREQIMLFEKNAEKQWILSQIEKYDQDIRRQAIGTLYEEPAKGLIWTDWIPRRYKHLETQLYTAIKDRFPDCTVVVKIQEIVYFFCFRYMRLSTQINWR